MRIVKNGVVCLDIYFLLAAVTQQPKLVCSLLSLLSIKKKKQNHSNLGPMNLVWNAPSGRNNNDNDSQKSELQEIIDQIIAIVNTFARPNYIQPASEFQALVEEITTRQVITLERCYFENNNLEPTGGFAALINVETGDNDLVVADSIFRDNNLGRATIVSCCYFLVLL